MDVLLAYFQLYPTSSSLLKTMAFLSNMFAASFADSFYSAFRAIASLSLAQTRFNEEEYVCELFTLLSSFPLQFRKGAQKQTGNPAEGSRLGQLAEHGFHQGRSPAPGFQHQDFSLQIRPERRARQF